LTALKKATKCDFVRRLVYRRTPFGFERISRTAYLYHMIYFISGAELVFVFFIILLVFGADKVPDIARTLGKGMRQVRNATEDIKEEIQNSAEKQGLDTKQIEQDIKEVKDEVENIAGSVKRNS
jgi:sec-independent protein translocase protein TatA